MGDRRNLTVPLLTDRWGGSTLRRLERLRSSMMKGEQVTIAQLIESAQEGRTGRAGSGGSWRTEISFMVSDAVTGEDIGESCGYSGALDRARAGAGAKGARIVQRAQLLHYSTRMLVWNIERPDDPAVLEYSTGWGSVSDQAGMNKAFRALGLPYRYSRSGGAEIEWMTPRLVEHNGLEAGRAAGSDSEIVIVTAARGIVAGRDDGKPLELDALPSLPLSGEWAGELLPRELLAEHGLDADDAGASAVLDAFEQGYSRGVEDAVRRSAELLG
jgi:hypothetical protein